MISENRIFVNPTIDATKRASGTGYQFGREDALHGQDQRGSAYFPICSAAWHAYNAGYAEGCALVAILTGRMQSYWAVGA